MPLLGYDIEPQGGKLRVNEVEANRVKVMYDLYLERESIMATSLSSTTAAGTTSPDKTKKGTLMGGSPFTKATLVPTPHQCDLHWQALLQRRSKRRGHDAIISPESGRRINRLLRRNGRTWRCRSEKQVRRDAQRNPAMCLLRLFDDATHTTKNGSKRYRYSVCMKAQKRGLEELQVQVRHRTQRSRSLSLTRYATLPRRGACRRGGGTSQRPIRARTGAIVAERDELVKDSNTGTKPSALLLPRLSQARPT